MNESKRKNDSENQQNDKRLKLDKSKEESKTNVQSENVDDLDMQTFLENYYPEYSQLGIHLSESENKSQLQATPEQHENDSKTVEKLQYHISEQKQRIIELKEQLKKCQQNEKDFINGFTEVNELQTASYQSLCDTKKQLNVVQKQAKQLMELYNSIGNATTANITKVDKLKEAVMKLQEEKRSVELQAEKQIQALKCDMESCEQKLKIAEKEQLELQSLLRKKAEKYKTETEIRIKCEKDLARKKEEFTNLSLAYEENYKRDEHSIKVLQEEIIMKKEEIAKLKSNSKKLSEQLSELNNVLNDHSKEKERLDQKLFITNNELQNLQVEYSELQKELQEKVTELTTLQNNLSESNKKKDDLNIKLEGILQSRSERLKKIQFLEEQVQEGGKVIQELENKRNQLCKSNEDYIKKIGMLEMKLEEEDQKNDYLTGELKKAEEISNDTDTKLQKFLKQIETLEITLMQKKKRNEAIIAKNKKKCEKKRDKLHHEIEQLKEKVTSDNEAIQQLSSENTNLKDEMEELIKEYNENEKELEVCKSEVKTVKEKSSALKSENSKMKKEIKEYEFKITEGLNEKKRLENALSTAQLDKQKLIDELTLELKNKKMDQNKCIAEIESLKKELEIKAIKLTTLNEQFTDLAKRSDELKAEEKEYNELKKMHSNLNEELIKKTESHKETLKELTRIKNNMKSSKGVLANLEKEYEDLIKECSELEGNLNEANEEENKLTYDLKIIQSNVVTQLVPKVHQRSNEPLSQNIATPESLKSLRTRIFSNESSEFELTSSFNDAAGSSNAFESNTQKILKLMDSTMDALKSTNIERSLSNLQLDNSDSDEGNKSLENWILFKNYRKISEPQSSQTSQPRVNSQHTNTQEMKSDNMTDNVKSNKFIKGGIKSVQFSSPLVIGKTSGKRQKKK